MVKCQEEVGRGGGGGGARSNWYINLNHKTIMDMPFFCSNMTCSLTHDKVPPVFRNTELT